MISGILLAAGNSLRMGTENKLLLPINGQPIFLNMIKAMKDSKLDEIIVILGHDYKEMMQLCKSSRLQLGINGNHLEGQTSSIKAGMQMLNPSTDAVMVCLCDMPILENAHLDKLIEAYEDGTILRPKNGQLPGNPSIFPKSLFDEILACEDDHGCKSVITKNASLLKVYNTDDKAYFVDIDTPEEYATFVS